MPAAPIGAPRTPGPWSLARARHPLEICAAFGLLTGLAAVVCRTVTSFEHGLWLIAYLLLVGFLAPLLLWRGQPAPATSELHPNRRADLQAGLWLLGTVAVPAGVLADMRLMVAIGSAALLAALLSMAIEIRSGGRTRTGTRPAWLLPAYLTLIAFLAGSVAVGLLLAWDTPWF